MTIRTYLLSLFFVTVANVTLAAKHISADSCRNVAKRFEALSNINPSELAKEAPRTLATLRQGETPNYYFICYNIYVENLFNQGRITEARQEIKKMLAEAIKMNDAECTTVARRAEGQFYYKIGVYKRAAECFRKGMETCPDYKQLRSYYTYSSTATWLAQADMRIGRRDEAELWLNKVEEMMSWLDKEHRADPSGHNQVRVKALAAQLKMSMGGKENIDKAKTLLSECKSFIIEALPKRAYTDYYVAQMQMATLEKRNTEAVALLDTLISIHKTDYRPICLEYMEKKADILADMKRCGEAVRLYKECMKQSKEVDNIAITQQLDEIRTEHEVEILKKDLQNETTVKRLAAVACLLLALVMVVTVWAYVNTRKKNAILINNIREQERNREMERAQAQMERNTEEQTQMEQGRQIVDYMKSSTCYLNADYGRGQIMDKLRLTDRQLTNSVTKVTGTTFMAYAKSLRLDHAVTQLSHSKEQTIAQIAEACGFGTLRNFQRQFKARFGVSPTDYLTELDKETAPS